MLQRIFFDHPATVQETYFQHMAFAFRFSALLFAAAGAAFVHAIIPCFFEHTAGNLIRRMNVMIETRR